MTDIFCACLSAIAEMLPGILNQLVSTLVSLYMYSLESLELVFCQIRRSPCHLEKSVLQVQKESLKKKRCQLTAWNSEREVRQHHFFFTHVTDLAEMEGVLVVQSFVSFVNFLKRNRLRYHTTYLFKFNTLHLSLIMADC